MLMRFDPFRDVDRLTGQLWGGRGGMAMDAYRHGDEYLVHFDLPGVDADSIDLTVDHDVLTVSAERRWQREEGAAVIAAERPQGTFTRQLFLGDGLDTEHVDASYENGVLTVRVPLADQARARKIEITSGSSSKQLGSPSTAA